MIISFSYLQHLQQVSRPFSAQVPSKASRARPLQLNTIVATDIFNAISKVATDICSSKKEQEFSAGGWGPTSRLLLAITQCTRNSFILSCFHFEIEFWSVVQILRNSREK
jgi:hypothetical protein